MTREADEQAITVRHGPSVAHCRSPGAAARLMATLSMEAGTTGMPRGGEVQPCEEGDPLLQQVQRAERTVLQVLLRAHPEVGGKAARNLGTCLRVKQVRNSLSGKSLRDVGLGELLGHISDAADAARHLSVELVRELVGGLPVLLPADGRAGAQQGEEDGRLRAGVRARDGHAGGRENNTKA